ncbi:MAG: hypothetical protein AB1393_10765 [Candidatus Edwardsbacteria bacterium]
MPHKIKCSRIKRWWEDYLEDTLTQEKRDIVEGHLRICPLCGAKMERAKRLVQLLKETEKKECPPFLETRLWARIREMEESKVKPQPAWKWRWVYLLVMSAVVALILIVWVIHHRTIPPSVQVPIVRRQIEKPMEPAEPIKTVKKETIKIKEPEIQIVYPPDDGIIPNEPVDISVAFYPAYQEKELSKIHLLLDNQDVSSSAEITSDFLIYSSVAPLEPGYHSISLSIEGKIEKNWFFYVLEES